MDKKKMLEMLNKALTMEHACYIRYLTHAAVLTGPYAEPVATRLKEIGQDEAGHAEKLRDRIVALGGTPTLEVEKAEGMMATELTKILAINIKEEESAIQMYQTILKEIPHDQETLLFETVEHILTDEMEHLEELTRLKG
ncbi:MAG: hypothetical protein HY347_12350 [candidate division NC10 bacterium]|nr:hypothetical protein [candidate division NC10 bacterium]